MMIKKNALVFVGSLAFILVGAIVFYLYFKSVSQSSVAVNRLQATASYDEELVSQIYDRTKLYANDTRIAIGIIEDESVSFYGLVRRNDTLYNESNASVVFEIGSITKVMTAHVMSALSYEGVLDINASILDHIAVDNEHLRPITPQHLANHTSGLPRLPGNMGMAFMDPYKNYKAEDLVAYLEKYNQDPEIGITSSYSNLGFGVLGYLMELLSGKSLENLFEEFIFAPSDMRNSSSLLSEVNNLAEPGRFALGSKAGYWNFDVMAGAGAVRSSADQMLRYIHMLMSEAEVVKRLREPTFRDDSIVIGNALMITERGGTGKTYWHNGGTGGFRSCMAFEVEGGVGVVVLSNVALGDKNDRNIDALCFDMLALKLKT